MSDFEKASDQAGIILENITASQIEVNEVYDILKSAFDSLEIKDTNKPIDPVEPKDPKEPEKPIEPKDPVDSKDSNGELPVTGSPWLTGTKVAGIGLTTLGAIVLFLKRKNY